MCVFCKLPARLLANAYCTPRRLNGWEEREDVLGYSNQHVMSARVHVRRPRANRAVREGEMRVS